MNCYKIIDTINDFISFIDINPPNDMELNELIRLVYDMTDFMQDIKYYIENDSEPLYKD